MSNEWLWGLFEFGITLIESYLLNVFLDTCLSHKKEVPTYWDKIGIVIMTGIILIISVTLEMRLKVGISLILYIMFAHLLYEGQLKVKFIYSVLFFILIAVVDIVFFQLAAILFNVESQRIIEENSGYRFVICILNKLILFAFSKSIFRNRVKKVSAIPKKIWHLILFIFIAGVINLLAIGEIAMEIPNNISAIFCLIIIALGIFICNVIVFFSFEEVCEYFAKSKEYELVECQNQMLTRAVQENEEYQKDVRKMHHDFNNHLSCIDMLLQMNNVEKARRYIQGMLVSANENKRIIRLGNEIAEAVVNQKYLLAQKQGIAFEVIGNLEENLQIDAVDLCALLSNALDNAIEASLRMEEVSKRNIQLEMKPYKDYLMIKVSNTVAEDVNVKNLKTSKADKSQHGIGMLSMKSVVEKYEGYLKYECENRLFNVSMMLKIKGNSTIRT